MTREEAISLLKQYIDYNNPDVPDFYTMAEACEVVIKTLEQEPCADMVSRDAMWEVLQRLYGTEGELVEELMSLPPVLPIPKMGKWRTVKHYGRDYYQCTYCNMERMNDHSRGWNYCPFCGTKMEVEE